jgi:hypothetical protein
LKRFTKKGIDVDPQAIQVGSLVFDPINIVLLAADGLGLDGLLTKAVASGTRGLADELEGYSAFSKARIEPWAPEIGEKVGRWGGASVYRWARGAAISALTGGAGIPIWADVLASAIPGWKGGRVAEALRGAGGGIGRFVGEIPQNVREKVLDGLSDALRAHAEDMGSGTNTLLANHGPAAPLLRPITAGAKGALYTVPFLAQGQSPEERGELLGFGVGAGALHATPEALRDASLSTLFFRDPENYQSINAAPIRYGTDCGGLNTLDHAHDAYVANLDPRLKQTIDDNRALLPKVEQYWLDNRAYQDAVTHLQRTVNPNTGESFLPAGNLKTRGLNVLSDPATGKAAVLINGDVNTGRSGLGVAAHEIGHSIYRTMTPQEQAVFKNLAFQFNDPDVMAQRYYGYLTGTPYKFTDLPTLAEIKSGAKQYLPGLDGHTQEHFVEEAGAETVAALLRGQPLDSFTHDPGLFRRGQFAVGRLLNKMGFNITPEEARTILGVKPSVAQMAMMDKTLRDYFKRNPANIPGPPAGGGGGTKPTGGKGGQKTAPVPTPTGGPAPGPTPPPSGGPHINNQANTGGGPTGATPQAVEDAIKGLQGLGFGKRQALDMINNSSGQSADELIRNALKLHGQARVQGGLATPREAQAPSFPHPLASMRLMKTGELVRRATFGDQQAVQALLERHGPNWLESAEKEDKDAATMYRRRFPEEAAAQDQRIKAAAEAKASAEARAKAEGREAPKILDGKRINELRAQAEREVGSRKFKSAKAREAAVNQRHLGLVMEEHAAMLPPGDSRVRARVDPDTGRVTYSGTHFDPRDPVHQWLLSRMDPLERRFLAEAQAAIANRQSMNFNYTHAARIEPTEELPTGPEREREYEEETAKERAEGLKEGQVGNRTALPISVGVGADGQGLLYAMASDKVIANAIKASQALRSARMENPYGQINRDTFPVLLDDMRKVAENHAAGYKGDGSAPLAGTKDRPVQVNPNYAPQQIPEPHAQFINMIMDARDPLTGPRVSKKGALTAAGKAVEFAEANKGYTSPILSRGQERVEVNPMRQALESKGAFRGRELEHGYEQFRADLMRENTDPAPALRKHGLAAEQITAAPERRFAAAGFMPEVPELRGQGADIEGARREKLGGRIVGAPPHIRTARDLLRLKDHLKGLMREGEAFRYWYKEGASEMWKAAGEDPQRFEQLIANIAVTSPQNTVYPNAGMAVRALAQQEAGGRRITIGKTGAMSERLAAVARGERWKGVKTNQFYRDHMAEIDPRLAGDLGSTMDMWMARAFGYPSDTFTEPQSKWAQGVMRDITQEEGWEKPKEAQAAIWSAIKGRWEAVWPDILRQAQARGDWIQKTKESGVKYNDFKDTETANKYRKRALQAAMKIDPPDLSDAAFNFADALLRDRGYVSYEARPGTTVAAREPWMNALTQDEWNQYHQDAAKILHDERGNNILAQAANLLTGDEHQGFSAWGPQRNLSQQLAIVMPKASGLVRERAGEALKIDPTVEKHVRDFANAVGLLFGQEGVGYHRPYYVDTESGISQKRANGVLLDQGRPLTREETGSVVDNLEKALPSWEGDGKRGWFVAPEPRGLKIISWGQEDGKAFKDVVKKVAGDTLPDTSTVTLRPFATVGDLVTNDWENNPNGEGYRRGLTARGRSDLLGLVDDTLAPRLAQLNARYAARYGARIDGGPEPGAGTAPGREAVESATPAEETPGAPARASPGAAMPLIPEAEKAPQRFGPPIAAAGLLPVTLAQQQERERKSESLPEILTEEPAPRPVPVRRAVVAVMPSTGKEPGEAPSAPSPPPQRRYDFSQEAPLTNPASPGNYTKGPPGREIRGIVLHSTDGNLSSALNELTSGERHASAHYLVTRDGRGLHLVNDNDIAHHAGIKNIDPEHFGNAHTIGIEQEHFDGQEGWPDAQVRRAAAITAHILQSHPNLSLDNVVGHVDVAPGQKIDPYDYPWAKFREYVTEFMGRDVGGLPHHGRYAGAGEEPSVAIQPIQRTAASQEAKKRAALLSANQIMREEGPSGSQDGVPEIFGFREGQDSEYPILARLRASGDEEGVRRTAANGIIDRAIKAGSQQFNDLRVKTALMSLAHMRGPAGAMSIMYGVGTGRLDKSGRADSLDPRAVEAINGMDPAEVMRRIQIARSAYDQHVLGTDYWNRFGRGLADRYTREREFYANI